MRRLILLSLSSFLLTGCGGPQVDKPDLSIAPAPCPPEIEADIPPEPAKTPGAGIVKPPPGSRAAAATDAYLNDVDALADWARHVLLPRVEKARAFCRTR